jgi:hypothetical protein
MLGLIAAYIIGLRAWQPDYNRLVTETEWQGGPHKAWILLYKPITHDYEAQHVGNEVVAFLIAVALSAWAYKNRHHKVDAVFARVVLVAAAAAALYFPLLWLARQHVEGDWTAVPPRLMKYEVDTPEFLAEQAALKAEWQQLDYARRGLTPTGEKIWHKFCIYY